MADLLDALVRHDEKKLMKAMMGEVKNYLSRHRSELNRLASSRISSLSSEERAALDAVGVKARPKINIGPLAAGALERKSIIDTSYTTEEVAKHLGVSVGRIRQRVKEKTLYSMRVEDGKSWSFPSWQFTDDGEVPSLKTVLKALPSDLNMQDVFGFFTTLQPDLEDENGEPMVPLDWLIGHGDPSEVSELARDL